DVLIIVAVEIHEQPIVVEDGGRGRPAPVVAGEVAPLPQLLSGAGVQARRAGTAEMHVHPALLDTGGAGGVAVRRDAEGGLRNVEDLEVEQGPARAAIEGQGEQFLAVGGSG